jgi:hypothetical protein
VVILIAGLEEVTLMPGGISQMQVLYNPEEDRILFRVSSTDGSEFRFWFSRRYTILLLKVLKEHVESDPDISTQENPEARQAVKSFKQEQAIKSANFNDEFREEPRQMPLGEAATLAFKLTYNIKGGNLNLGIQPKTGQGINIVINREINTTLTQLLVAAARKGEWLLNQVRIEPVGQANGKVIN